MEKSGSEGLDDLLMERKNDFLADVDYVCISDNFWLGKKRPCLTYGLRGFAYFQLEIECSTKDLHSGVFGGTVHEAMPVLCYLLSVLFDKDTNILIPGVDRDEVTGKNVILVPVGACDDGAHSQNEKIDIYNYIEGAKLLGAYLHEVGKLYDDLRIYILI
ncbi:GL11061 [Drosophila persimilis]|uniref:GL11061 n=1 Tax=Drosophila persimilis TaxID=7234 RepID=B4GBJ6_DROPE|nr:GL11061 [Drosophila persimilis]